MQRLVNALVVVAFFGAAWFVYTDWIESEADPDVEEPGFDCRGALTRLARDYRCRDDANCELSEQELARLRELEAEIEENCN